MPDLVLLGRLYAIREALDAIIETLEDAPAPKQSCPHPLDKRKYTGETMGLGDSTCGQCGDSVPNAESIIDRVIQK